MCYGNKSYRESRYDIVIWNLRDNMMGWPFIGELVAKYIFNFIKIDISSNNAGGRGGYNNSIGGPLFEGLRNNSIGGSYNNSIGGAT